MRLDIVYLIWNLESRYLESEVGGLSSTGKSFRGVRAACMSSEFGVKISGPGLSLFPFRLRRFSLFPSPPQAPQSPIQLQLALLVYVIETRQNQ